MDNPATESTDLNTDTAAEAFAELIDREEGEQPAEPEEAQAAQEEAPAEESTESQEEDPLVTIKVDGKDVQVPLSELKNGYQRQADYTRKTMQVAEERKAAEAERQQALAERHQYAGNLQKLQAQIEGALAQQQNIDWQQLLENDPQAYLKERHLWEQRQAALQQNLSAQQQLAGQMQAEQARAYQGHLQAQQEQLLAKLPEWKDAEKAKAEKTALRDYLKSQGYDEQSVNSVADARAVLMARKAMMYDQMMSKAQTAQKKVSNLPTKVQQPGNGTNPGIDRRASAYQRLTKTGRVEDAAAVFASLL
jgi:hypothetical protein